mgnify:CR=1 FL=1
MPESNYEERWRKLEEHLPAIREVLINTTCRHEWCQMCVAAKTALAFIESLEKEEKNVE